MHSPRFRAFDSGIAMLWIEAIINLSAFAGFIGIANINPKSCD
jgi:hypothetical protein